MRSRRVIRGGRRQNDIDSSVTSSDGQYEANALDDSTRHPLYSRLSRRRLLPVAERQHLRQMSLIIGRQRRTRNRPTLQLALCVTQKEAVRWWQLSYLRCGGRLI